MYYTIIQIYFGKLYNVNIPNYLNNQILFNNNNKLYLFMHRYACLKICLP